MMKNKLFLLQFLLIFMLSCNSKDMPDLFTSSSKNHKEELKKDDYIEWCCNRDNGLIVDKTINKLTFSLQYKSPEYVIVAELKEDFKNKEKLNEAIENNNQWQYFTFRISSDQFTGDIIQYNLKSNNEFSDRINYLTFNVQNDFSLVCCKDTFPCLIYHLERNFGSAPYCNMLLGFENPGLDSLGNCDRTLIYNDRVFNSGIIKLTVTSDAISNLPRLIF